MKSAITKLSLIDLLFIVCLLLCSGAQGFWYYIIYYCTFIIPIALGIYMLFLERDEIKRESEYSIRFKIERSSCAGAALLIFPTIAVIMLISYLTSLLMGLLGYSGTVISGGLTAALIEHALIPSLLEEILFRYIPLILLARYGGRWAIGISALLFSLAHTNILQMPYALAAGIMLALIDIMSESILPSLIIHFINNTLSVICMLYPLCVAYVYICVGLLALFSVILLIAFRKRRLLNTHALKGKGKFEISYSIIAFFLLSMSLAIANL